jgi:hypothetical protein
MNTIVIICSLLIGKNEHYLSRVSNIFTRIRVFLRTRILFEVKFFKKLKLWREENNFCNLLYDKKYARNEMIRVCRMFKNSVRTCFPTKKPLPLSFLLNNFSNIPRKWGSVLLRYSSLSFAWRDKWTWELATLLKDEPKRKWFLWIVKLTKSFE